MDYDYDYSAGAAAGIGIFIAFTVFYLLLVAAVYVLSALAFSRLFKKVGIEGWIAWVPIYNIWKWLELGGQSGWLSLLIIVPWANIATVVFLLIGSYRTGTAFGKGGEWTVLAYFLSPLWAFLLSRPSEVYRPEVYAQHGWPPPLAGYGSVPAAQRQPGGYQPPQPPAPSA